MQEGRQKTSVIHLSWEKVWLTVGLARSLGIMRTGLTTDLFWWGTYLNGLM